MRKLIAAINMTLDGFCDHTSVDPDDEIHQHYTDLLKTADSILYGRITYQLMEYWRPLATHHTENKSMDEFAVVMNNITKIVFSRTLKEVDWKSARLASRNIEEEVTALKQEQGKDILVGSPSLIVALAKLNLIDEFQICVHPVIVGSGLPLFKNISDKIALQFIKTKIFSSGAVILYYKPKNRN